MGCPKHGVNKEHYYGIIVTCETVCGEVFPRWRNSVNFDIHGLIINLPGNCPCRKMSSSYVLRQIKKLYPELY